MRWDVGIDLGTLYVRMSELGEGTTLAEASALAFREGNETPICAGSIAQKLIGRTCMGVSVVRPLRDGVLENNFYADRLFRWFFNRMETVNRKRHFNVLIACAPFSRPVQKEALLASALNAGATEAALVRSDIAGALGADMDIFSPEAKLLVDIGAGKITCTLFTMGRVAAFGFLPYGVSRIEDRIIRMLRVENGHRVGQHTATEIKHTLGSALPSSAPQDIIMHAVGIGMYSRLPETFDVESKSVLTACEDISAEIARLCASVVESAPEELSADLVDTGAVLIGGGALMTDMDRRISQALGIPCHIAEDPEGCVSRGLHKIQQNEKEYAPLLSERQARSGWN